MPEINEFLPGNLRRLREKAGYTQVKMGEMLGLKQSSYSQWETGVVKVPTYALGTLAFLLNCQIEDLLTEPKEDEKNDAT